MKLEHVAFNVKDPAAISKRPRREHVGLWPAVVIAFVIAAYDGFFGPGTGTFLAIAFTFFMHYDLVTASGNARLANLASNAGSLAVFLINGKVLFPIAFITAVSGIAGNILQLAPFGRSGNYAQTH